MTEATDDKMTATAGCNYRGGGFCTRPITEGPIIEGDRRSLCAQHYAMMCRERRTLQWTLGGLFVLMLGPVAVIVTTLLKAFA